MFSTLHLKSWHRIYKTSISIRDSQIKYNFRFKIDEFWKRVFGPVFAKIDTWSIFNILLGANPVKIWFPKLGVAKVVSLIEFRDNKAFPKMFAPQSIKRNIATNFPDILIVILALGNSTISSFLRIKYITKS